MKHLKAMENTILQFSTNHLMPMSRIYNCILISKGDLHFLDRRYTYQHVLKLHADMYCMLIYTERKK